jgi:DNA polymerase-4
VVVGTWARTPELPGLVVPPAAMLGPPIVHVDADAFFVAVERRDRPALRGRPVVVASDLVLSVAYEARAAGVRAGMLVNKARGLCPDLVVRPPRWDAYAETSGALFELLKSRAAIAEGATIEDVYLDIDVDWSDAEDAAQRIRARVVDELGIPVSAGVARTKALAAVASRRAKPAGCVVIAPASEADVRAAVRIVELNGVGRATRSKLRVQGIESVGELRPFSAVELTPIVGRAMARRLYRIAQASDDARVVPRRPRPAIGAVVHRPVQLPLALELN